VIPAGPAIRRFAREVGVDLANVRGTGDNGRIGREDILSVVRAANQSARSGSQAAVATSSPAAPASAPAAGLPGTADQDDFGPIRVERMSKIRKTISRQMHLSWSSVPRVTNFDDADISDLERLRQSSKDDYAAQGLKLTTMPFLIKAVATALRHHPSMNAMIDEANEQIIYKDYVNIGIAVDTDRGLVVPVMQEADRLGVPQIARSLAEMAGKVRGGTFGMNDLRGGSFTISNLGTIGGQYSTPIVNVPEVAILLVGRSRKLPVVMADDSIKPRLMMPLSLSYDHRLVDGGTAARFLNDVIGFLEAPSRLLLAL
jgi:pyruvate dehydrogenase E2 component (dihydrolipoamide acetyltransferase)